MKKGTLMLIIGGIIVIMAYRYFRMSGMSLLGIRVRAIYTGPTRPDFAITIRGHTIGGEPLKMSNLPIQVSANLHAYGEEMIGVLRPEGLEIMMDGLMPRTELIPNGMFKVIGVAL